MDGIEILLAEIVFWWKLFLASATFFVLKIFLEIYVLVLFFDMLLLIKQRAFRGDFLDTIIGMNVPPELVTKKGKLRAKWDKVRAKMQSGNQSDYKVAIIEGDNIIDDLIARMGYKGENFSERLDNINPGQIENIEELRLAHEMRNRIIHDESLVLTKEEAQKTLGYFEEFLRYFQVLE
jgi:hypothetical protein